MSVSVRRERAGDLPHGLGLAHEGERPDGDAVRADRPERDAPEGPVQQELRHAGPGPVDHCGPVDDRGRVGHPGREQDPPLHRVERQGAAGGPRHGNLLVVGSLQSRRRNPSGRSKYRRSRKRAIRSAGSRISVDLDRRSRAAVRELGDFGRGSGSGRLIEHCPGASIDPERSSSPEGTTP